MKKRCLLVVIDGYGEGKDYPYNAVTRSNTPFLDSLRKDYPTTLLQTSRKYVGLPDKSMGGSEVGHFTIGAGRIVYQPLERINQSIKKGDFFKLKDLKKAAKNCKKHNSKFHILGMISDQGVHAHINHLFALLKFAKKEKLEKVYIHAITDGRDVPEKSASKFMRQINAEIKKQKLGKIATIVGRYYAMDRDKNLTRTQKAFDLYTKGEGRKEKNALTAIKNEYAKGTETDYYINPILLDEDGLVEKNDAVVFFNYRTDRTKQLTEMFTKTFPKPFFLCFGPYSKIAPVLFEPEKVKNNLGETLSLHKKTQLRIAETEKYAHVTFFFNSQKKEPYPRQKNILIPSDKVPSYDQKPEMQAEKISKTAIKAIKSLRKPDFILANYANGDLVGHSGNFKATVKGVEAVDKAIAKLIPLALEKNYEIILTADHGNAEFMRYPNGDNCPSHTLNPVICIFISKEKASLRKGKTLGLAEIAPTILERMRIKKPKEMTAKSLIK